MDTEVAMEKQHSLKSSPARQQSSALGRKEALVRKLARFYSVTGNPPDEPGALSLMAEIISQTASDDQIDHALTRCAREFKYPVRLPDILQRIPGQEIPDPEAQARAAWDRAVRFARREVFSNPTDGDGVCVNQCFAASCSVKEHHYVDAHLPQQLRDVVRRVGGWRAVSLALNQSNPWVKKEFIAEWHAYQAVELVGRNQLSPRIEAQVKQLAKGKAMFSPVSAGTSRATSVREE